jgi:asparagine synthase (glutamine-hydrolysing)
MCGLFGHYSQLYTSDLEQVQSRLLAAKRALHHRGPDDSGLASFVVSNTANGSCGSLSLGHTRLSIIDLSPSGHQPMHSCDGRYTIIFNGEIYNYRELRSELESAGHIFFTNTDTEVLLAAWTHWGISGLRNLVGMFAFAAYDRQEESLTLVRDGFGIKPLLYSRSDTCFDFASDLPALLALLPTEKKLDLQHVYNYLTYGRYDDNECTFFKGIFSLLPGHWLCVDLRTLRTTGQQRWWWPSIKQRSDLSFDDAARRLREIFLNNVRLHLRSDVPVGAALSGGLDSSAVVCAMRHLEPQMPIHTFSFIAPDTIDDEEHWADIVNSHVGGISHKVLVRSNELSDDLEDLIKAQGEPFGSTSIYAQFRVYRLARQAGIKVTLDGQGADELLAGYDGYPVAYLRSLFEGARYTKILCFLRAWAEWPGRGMKRAILMLGAALIPERLQQSAHWLIGHNPIPSWLAIQWMGEQGVNLNPPLTPRTSSEAIRRRLMERLRRAMTSGDLAPLLRHGDRNSMRWSIESRVPFLTIELAEFLLSLPEPYLLSSRGETKSLFRAAMRGIVPDVILDRRDKIGFKTPEHVWLRAQKNVIQKCLIQAAKFPFINSHALRQEINLMLHGHKSFTPQAWRLINFCLWAQVYRPSI